MSFLRLDKIISDLGRYSRRDSREIIRLGRVTIDGVAVRSPDEKVDPKASVIAIDGVAIYHAKFRYFIMNKPSGIITATEDKRQKTVIDLLPQSLRGLELFPVGRLDKDTTGLLLITNDGDYAHRVISPKKHVDKVYLAQVDVKLEELDKLRFREGILLADGTRCLPGELEIISDYLCRVTIHEGKYHQVKRMLAACGKHVLLLHREAIGGICLDEKLQYGEIRELENSEEKRVFS